MKTVNVSEMCVSARFYMVQGLQSIISIIELQESWYNLQAVMIETNSLTCIK